MAAAVRAGADPDALTMGAVADDVEQLSTAFLTDVLAQTCTGAVVESVRAERIGTGQMGTCHRLHLEGDGVPPSLVAKLAADDRGARERVKEGYRKEVRFYQELGARVFPHAPRCWYAAISDDALAFTLLFADLAPAVAGVQVEGCTREQAVAAVRNLAGIHAATWDDTGLRAERWLQPWDVESGAFLGDVLVGAMDEFLDRYGDRLGEADAATLRASAASTGAWAGAPVEHVAVVHGDYRLDNLMFAPAGGVTALDWQTATFGSPTRDLAYFLETSLTVDLRRRHETELLAAYTDALVEGGVDRGEAEASLRRYRADLRQGPLITVLGAVYATAPTDSSDAMFLAMASRSCAALRDHGVLEEDVT